MNYVWSGWLLALVVTFGIFETYALLTGHTSLSQYVRAASIAWPVLPFVLGVVVGGLAVHFWWTSGG